LIPFIDMMTILVVFLLAHTAEVDILPTPRTSRFSVLVRSQAERGRGRDDHQGLVVRDGELVGSLNDVVANQGPYFAPLKNALTAQNARSLGQQTDIAKREVTIMGDKSTPYSVLKKIMMTCSEAEYGKVSFAVVERERRPPK